MTGILARRPIGIADSVSFDKQTHISSHLSKFAAISCIGSIVVRTFTRLVVMLKS